MITIQYIFEVPENQHATFEEAWQKVTEIYLHYSNSRGSRLWYDENAGHFVAVAFWPSAQDYAERQTRIPKENPELEMWGKAMDDTGYTLVERRELQDRINLWK